MADTDTTTPVPVPTPHAIEPLPMMATAAPLPPTVRVDGGGLDASAVVLITVLTVLAIKTLGAAWDRIEDLMSSRH